MARKTVATITRKTMIIVTVITLFVGALFGYEIGKAKYIAKMALVQGGLMQQLEDVKLQVQAVRMQSGFIMKGNSMYVINAGQMMLMDKNMTLKDGTEVTTTGQVMMKDGTTLLMQNDQALTADDKLINVSMD
ncbi:MAG TPA: DUF6799 domain-containing protein [Patescibacteria group bacterium]|nr:DUF6799 domain-containing protein [Patescibacteria group bacterium]